MEFEAIQKYTKSPLLHDFSSNLPMQEFLQGNFSKAFEVIALYQNMLATCIKQSTVEYTGREDGDWKQYIQDQKVQLGAKKAELVEAYNAANSKVKIATSKKKKDLQILDEKFTEENRKKFCNILGASTDSISIRAITSDAKGVRRERLDSLKDDIKSIIDQNCEIKNLASKRDEIKRDLDHKGNYYSIQRQINDLTNGSEAEDLIRVIKGKLHNSLTGSHFARNEIEDKQGYLMEVFVTELCKHSSFPDSFRNKILTNHTDKVGVFQYTHSLYLQGYRTLQELKNPVSLAQSINEIEEQLIIYNKMLQNYHRSTKISEEDIQYIRTILEFKKTASWQQIIHSHERLQKIYHFIADLDIEKYPNEFEEKMQQIRNADYYGYFQNTQKLYESLVILYTVMDTEEKEFIYESYNMYSTFQKIYKQHIASEKENKSKQGLLFGFNSDDRRDVRIRTLQQMIANNELMPDTLGDEEKNALETLIFSTQGKRLPLRYKKNQYATKDNRTKSREHKQAVRVAYIKELLDQELIGRKNFPRAVRILQPHIIYDKEPLYIQFPVNEQKTIEA